MNNFSNPLCFNHRVSKLQTEQRKQRNYHNLKSPYDGANWKNFALTRPRNISLQDLDRMSSKTSVRGYQTPVYYEPQHCEQNNGNSVISQRRVREQNLRLSGVTYSNKREQHATRVKQDALRRVKMLQEKVLPLISGQKHLYQEQNEEYGLAWQLKLEQRLVKIENSIQKVKNQIQIKYEKRLMEIQRQWEERITELLEFAASGEEDVRQMMNDEEANFNGNERGEQQQESGTQLHGRYHQVNGSYDHYDQMNRGYDHINGQYNQINGQYDHRNDGYDQINGGHDQMNGRVYRLDYGDDEPMMNGHVRHT